MYRHRREEGVAMQLFTRACRHERMNVERIAARAFVIAGGAVWTVAALGAPYGNRTISMLSSVANSFALLAATVVVFLIGWFYERVAALLLLAAAALTFVYGLVTGWEPGVWLTMGAILIAPTAIAGLLFLLAARMQTVCELTEGAGETPAVDTNTAARA
jgi:hypothetical protein